MEIKRRVLIVAIVLEAFFATLSNGICEYLIALNILYALSETVKPQLAQWSVYLHVSSRVFNKIP